MSSFAAYTAPETRSQCFSVCRITPQNVLLPMWISTPSNTWFFGPTPVNSFPNLTFIGSAVFAGRTNVTNRQTDIQTDHTIPDCSSIGRFLLLLQCGLKFLCAEWNYSLLNLAEMPAPFLPSYTRFLFLFFSYFFRFFAVR